MDHDLSNRKTPRVWGASGSVLLGVTVLLCPFTQASAFEGADHNYDARTKLPVAFAFPSFAQLDAITDLQSQLKGTLLARLNNDTGATRSLSHATDFLTGPEVGGALDIGLAYVERNVGLLGLEASDLANYEITDVVFSKVSGATHIYLRQRYQGLPVYNGQLQVHVNRDGRIMSVNNDFVPNVAVLNLSPSPATYPEEAVQSAASHLKLPMTVAPMILSSSRGLDQTTTLEAPTLSREVIDARLMWLPMGSGLKLVWNLTVHTPDKQHVYDMTIDAEAGAVFAGGERVLTRFDHVSAARYNVYAMPAESPNHAPNGRTLVIDPENATASPEGWHSTGSASYTIMRGNNVHAYDDRARRNRAPSNQPDCGVNLSCDFPLDLSLAPSEYIPAAVANLFYWNNIIHDIQYQYGFDEAAGNFQVNNFGRGGRDADAVRAEAQDGSGSNNANMFTPADGRPPRMQMFLWTQPNPDLDGDLDAGIIVHEYGHGISTRQVGGPSNSSCLSNRQQPGEGWSDVLALMYTAEIGDTGADRRGIGTYALDEPVDGDGIRQQPYSTDSAINNHTYASIGNSNLSVPHGVGEVWSTAVWEAYWVLVNKYGFDPNLYNAQGGAGNQRAMLYVNEGLKNTSCNPTFIDARNGILQAAANNYGGADVCSLWVAFAEFGLGSNASTGGPNTKGATDGFLVPCECTAQGCDSDPPPPTDCAIQEGFETSSTGWTNAAASTCTTGDFIRGAPTTVTNGGITTQVGGANSGTNAMFTASNSSAGVDDVDGGNCILSSPTWTVAEASTLSVSYFHGQRDGGDDANGDFFKLEYSLDGGSTWTDLVSIGDASSNAAWMTVTGAVPAGSAVQLRVQCSDGAASGDLVECGIDDVSICPSL